MTSVLSRAKRILRPMARFRFFAGQASPVPDGLPITASESLIGVYLNEPGSLTEAIVVTDQGLVLESGGAWVPIPYASITEALMPTTKTDVKSLTLVLRGGLRVTLPVMGGSQRTSDAFEVLRFLDRVLADLRDYLSKEARRMVAGHRSDEEILGFLRQNGATILQSIKILGQAKSIGLGEAKKIVHFSETWSDYRESSDALHETLERTVKELEREGKCKIEIKE